MSVPLTLRRRLAKISADPRMQRIVLGLLLGASASSRPIPDAGVGATPAPGRSLEPAALTPGGDVEAPGISTPS